MVSVTELGERTVGYLRKHVFSDGKEDYVQRNGVLVPSRLVDFGTTQEGLSTVDRSWVRDRVLNWVRNSEEYVVIDIAAGFGSGYEAELAKRFPKVQVFITDAFGEGGMEASRKQTSKFPKDMVFSTIPNIPDPEQRMNAMLQENGYRNIRYIDRELIHGVNGTGTQFPELEEITKCRHVIVTGICNPQDIALVTAREAAYHGAEQCYIVPTGLEYLDPSNAAEFFHGTNGMLSDEERIRLFALNTANLFTESEEQTRVVLKQAFMIGLAQRLTPYFSPTIYRYENPRNSYNEPDHLVAGKQIAVMDRSTVVAPEKSHLVDISRIIEVLGSLGVSVVKLD